MYDSNLAAESRYFEVYIQPLLKYPNKRPKNIRYFFQQGWLGWRHSVQQKDLRATKFVESLCEQLYKENGQEFLQVAGSIIDAAYLIIKNPDQETINLAYKPQLCISVPRIGD